MKQYKKEADGILEIGQVLYTKHFKLELDRSLCKSCELCRLVCPRGAIGLIPQPDKNGRAVAPLVGIAEHLCDYHAICAVVCPYNAIRISINDNYELPSVVKEVFPVLIRDIQVDNATCPHDCTVCADACPLNLIEVYPGEAASPEVIIDGEHCPTCLICEQECPQNNIRMTQFVEGSIRIDNALCPDGCQRCLDVCPVSAIVKDDQQQMLAKDINCYYCGACKLVCPVPEALQLVRTAFHHTPVSSGAWNRGLEKITSQGGLQRELTTDRLNTVRDAIAKLIPVEENE